MLYFVMFGHSTATVWTHLPLAVRERTELLPHFWEKPGWKKTDIMEPRHHVQMGGHCVCVWNGFRNCNVLQDLCEVVGSVVRNCPIGQCFEEVQHWNGVLAGALGHLSMPVDYRWTHFRGSLRKTTNPRRVAMRRRPTEHWVLQIISFNSENLK